MPVLLETMTVVEGWQYAAPQKFVMDLMGLASIIFQNS